jgi:hypothetical protein
MGKRTTAKIGNPGQKLQSARRTVRFFAEHPHLDESPSAALPARGESPAAFGRRRIPPGCVAPPSNIPDILGRRALPAGRRAGLGATPDFHHGLLPHQAYITANAACIDARTFELWGTPGKKPPCGISRCILA